MHYLELRAMALLSLSFTLLTLLCAMISFSDYLNFPSPSVDILVMKLLWFQKSVQGDDEANMMMLNITGNLESLFTWNTKLVFVFLAAEYETPRNLFNQISLWDGIIPSKKNAKFSIHTTNKYRFTDQGNNLRGKDYNLSLHWHVMPKSGKGFADKIVKSSFSLPKEYK